MNKIATTITCYGNLYLSDQFDVDKWIIYASQFRDACFQFYTLDGKLVADYLAQWFEYQKKRGAKQFFLQLPDPINQAEDSHYPWQYRYHEEFTIICQFAHEQEIWVPCYPKTIAASSNLNLDHKDSYAGHHSRPTSYVLAKVNTNLAKEQLPTDWQALKIEIINSLNQLWPTDERHFSSNSYDYTDRSSINEFPWHLPTLPPDKHLITPHQLLIGLGQLTSTYENDTNGKNEGNVFYTLPKEELDRFLAHGALIHEWTKKVLLLASLEIRWQISPDDPYIQEQTPDTNPTIIDSDNQPITAENPIKEQANSKKGCFILSAIIIALILGVSYAFYQAFWLTLSVLLLLYIIIKK